MRYLHYCLRTTSGGLDIQIAVRVEFARKSRLVANVKQCAVMVCHDSNLFGEKGRQGATKGGPGNIPQP